MSQQLIGRSPDLARLADEGYAIEIRSGYLLLRDVPYVNRLGDVRTGMLVSTLDLVGDVTRRPDTHVVMFAGEEPCDAAGQPLYRIQHSSGRQVLGAGLAVDFTFSSKPAGGYADYFHKMTTYANILASQAQQVDPAQTARTYRAVEDHGKESVFRYVDTASTRAGIGAISSKLAVPAVAIVGLGGTGAYILDLLAKAPVLEIHLFDGDRFRQHNAFRAPGGASTDDLNGAPKKVDFYAKRYGAMRTGIVPHGYAVDESNLHELGHMQCVFICVDAGAARRLIIEELTKSGSTFIDVGMGLQILEEDLSILGQIRVTTSSPGQRDHVNQHVPVHDGDAADLYRQNIQVADLNALNATLAVIRWKKMRGFYHDAEGESHSVYVVDGNCLINTGSAL